MENCRIKFIGEPKQLAGTIYEDLQKKGVSCQELDGGYEVINYAGIHCPDKTAKTCTKGGGDGVIEAEEVLEYAFNNYEKYREILEGGLGRKLPWLLDDFDPSTDFDAQIRKKVQGAIDELTRVLMAKGLKEGGPEYQEMLAVGLHWFVAFPRKGLQVSKEMMQPYFDRIKADGLSDFLVYLSNNGGLASAGDYTREYSAIEAIRNNYGECTENSKILFAVLKMVGITPVFIHEDILKEDIGDPIARAMTAGYSDQMKHICVAVNINEKMRILDPSLLSSNASYKHYIPLSNRIYLGLDFENTGIAWNGKSEFDKSIDAFIQAIAINSKSASAYRNFGITLRNKGDIEGAMSNFTEAVSIEPDNAYNWYARGQIFHDMEAWDRAISDYTNAILKKPELQEAYLDRGGAWFNKGEWGKAIPDFTEAIRIKPELVLYAKRAFCRYLIGDVSGAIQDYSEVFKLKKIGFPALADQLSTKLNSVWMKKDKIVANSFKHDTSLEIAMFEVRILLCYALWLSGDVLQADTRFYELVGVDLSFKGKPSQFTKKFITKMLDAMPKSMRESESIMETTKPVMDILR